MWLICWKNGKTRNMCIGQMPKLHLPATVAYLHIYAKVIKDKGNVLIYFFTNLDISYLSCYSNKDFTQSVTETLTFGKGTRILCKVSL